MTSPAKQLLAALLCAGTFVASAPLAAQQPSTAPAAAARAAAPVERDSLVALARSQLGRRYLFGGTDPDRGFDCSGFTRYLMRALGVQLPRTAQEQAAVGREVPLDPARLRVGDLLTFGRGGRITHVGVYVGDGRYIHASSYAGRIVESRLERRESSLARAWVGVRRLLAESEAPGDSTAAVAAR
ncbi:MAG TPA: C40 family peptidase [Longimicrobiaceae bacterium]|nr:C40 family peptidase [Longimicrobiaceae bacterium]